MNLNPPLLFQALSALKARSVDRLRAALDQGLDPNVFETVSLGSGSITQRHILYAAIAAGDPGCMKTLLNAGSDPMRARTINDSPLNRACAEFKLALADLLIDAGDDVNARFDGDWTRLHKSPSSDGPSVLIAPGWTVVHTAASLRSVPLLQLLHTRGANLDVVTEDGRTPLMLTGDSAEATRWLLQFLSHRVNAQDKTGVTALMGAVACKDMGVVSALLGADADTELVTRAGLGAISLAETMGFDEIASQLSLFAAARQARSLIGALKANLGIAAQQGLSP